MNSASAKSDHRIVVMGLGNVLYGDEGVGVYAVERLYRLWDFPEHVEVVDGGTQGHTLLTYVERADSLLILDAVDFGLPPGKIHLREGDDIPQYLTGHKISPHQNSFSEVLALAKLRGAFPQRVTLLGMQPHTLALGAPLSELAEEKLVALTDAGLQQLRLWGVEPQRACSDKYLYHPAINDIQ